MAADHIEKSTDAGDNAVDWKTRLHGCLRSITSTDTVATGQCSRHYANPGLTIGDDLLIGLPLTERDALVLKGRCREAPFGRRDETVVDASVRKTWELDHTQFKLANPRWQVLHRAPRSDRREGTGHREGRRESV